MITVIAALGALAGLIGMAKLAYENGRSRGWYAGFRAGWDGAAAEHDMEHGPRGPVKLTVRDSRGNDVTDEYIVGPVTALVTNDGNTWGRPATDTEIKEAGLEPLPESMTPVFGYRVYPFDRDPGDEQPE